jgi:stage II sporulation protein D
VLLEDYVKGVVASEMPTSWHPEAVAAQTVAARSYAVRIRDFYSYDGYDICDTTACQVYGGINRETSAGNAAVRATNGTVVTYRGAVALTQFASSNGGHSAQGDHPYLAPKPDPYDSVIKSQAWTRTVSASSIASRWSVGTVRKLQITDRDGAGSWGGRVESIKIIGSSRTITITGYAFYRAYNLRSRLYTFGGSSAALAPAPLPAQPGPTIRPGAKYATFPRSYHSGFKVDLTLVNPAGQLRRYPVVNGKLGTSATIGSDISGYTLVVNAGDWNGDGYQDVIVRRTERVYLLRGTKTGQLASRISMGFGGGVRTMTGIGDANRDGKPDLAVITAAGNLWLYYGDGKTGRKSKTKIGSGWAGHDWLRAPGDFDRDGRVDLITKVGGRMLLHRGTASGFTAPVTLASGWSGVSTITSVGDVNGDKKADVVARISDGRLVVYTGDGKDTLTRGATLPGSYSGTRFAI